MSSKAEDLLLDKYNWDASHPDYSTASFRKDEVLRAMKEIASIAFAAGVETGFKNSSLVQRSLDHQTGIKKDFASAMKAKEDFLSKLFDNE